MKTLRLFISSPGDVGREREATRRVIDRLQSEFAEHITLDPYFWEWEPVDFGQDYQSQIPSTADFDIVICLLWSKLGSRLGDQYKLPPDGKETASSGTQYELMQALHGKQRHPEKLPDLLVWVNKAPPPPASSPPLSRKDEDELIRQRRALQDFLATITRDTSTGIFTAAVNRYEVPSEDLGSHTYLDEFVKLMDEKLRKLIQKHIGQRTLKPKPQWQGSPFRDLDVFEFEHAPIFFGRDRAVGEVVRLLQSTGTQRGLTVEQGATSRRLTSSVSGTRLKEASRFFRTQSDGLPESAGEFLESRKLFESTLSNAPACHFALILGASGSGKSSLARAGVLPLLTRPGVIEGIGLWRCAIVRPSDDSADLFQALAAALLRSTKEQRMGSHRFSQTTDGKAKDSPICGSTESVGIPPPSALPELADPEYDQTKQQSLLAAELRAHPQAVAIRVKDPLSAVAKAHQTSSATSSKPRSPASPRKAAKPMPPSNSKPSRASRTQRPASSSCSIRWRNSSPSTTPPSSSAPSSKPSTSSPAADASSSSAPCAATSIPATRSSPPSSPSPATEPASTSSRPRPTRSAKSSAAPPASPRTSSSRTPPPPSTPSPTPCATKPSPMAASPSPHGGAQLVSRRNLVSQLLR